MLKIALTTLQIKVLLKCADKPLSKRNVTQVFSQYKKPERDQAIDELIYTGFLEAKELPKPGAKKTPIFYIATSKGIKWVEDYNTNYPV